ncbi:MAG: glycosyltransferase [Hyphomicrobiaceae bacterium]|nr:glycosyltransferase [Hyphomicrobiaceae bacterium]
MFKRSLTPRPVHRVALVAATARNLIEMRGPFVRALLSRGVTVLCIAPEFTASEEATLESMGVERATFNIVPRGPRFAADWQIVRDLKEKFAAWKPDAVMAVSGRVLALAMMAAQRARVARRIAIINGLPPPEPVDDRHSTHGVLPGVVDRVTAGPRLLAQGLRAATAVVFHNRDDRRRLTEQKLLPALLPSIVVPGAGVDLAHFAETPLPALSKGLVFLMIATLDRSRGVLDYCAAATSLKERAPQARFLLAGPAGDGPTGLKPEALRPYADAVTFIGPLVDVRPALADCHVLVYPSHAEGMPRAVLEALATGRPVVTTATPGCRDTVDDRVNGCLVPAGDTAALELALASFLKRPDLLPAMSRASRVKAERNFGQAAVLSELLGLLEVADRPVSETVSEAAATAA